MIKDFSVLTERLRTATRRRVGVIAADDEHTLEAVARAEGDGLVEPVLIGDRERVRRLWDSLSGGRAARIEDVPEPSDAAFRAAELVRAGELDCLMKGRIETAQMMKALVDRERGIRKGGTMSVVAFMDSPYYHKILAVTDVGLLTYPTKEQKRAEIENVVEAYHRLGVERPKVALICAVEKVNPKMRETVEAAELKAEGVPGCVIEGPISYDLAVDARSAAIKGYESEVAGDADILVVPDIVSGNIATKSLTFLGGSRVAGVVYGAMAPVLMVSRAATADDKYMSIVIGALTGGLAQ